MLGDSELAPDPHNTQATDDFFNDDIAISEWLAEKRGIPSAIPVGDLFDYLGAYGYEVYDEETWDGSLETFPELRIRVRVHAELAGHTHYRLDCAFYARGTKSPYLMWTTMRRLVHIRWGVHHPVKKALGDDYCKWFENSRFAKLFGPAGTTARLDAWCKSLTCCMNERRVNPEKTAAILQILDAPGLCQKIGEKTAFGRVLVDTRNVRTSVLEEYKEVQELFEQEQQAEEDIAPDAETILAQFEKHGLIDMIEHSENKESGLEISTVAKGHSGASKGLPKHGLINQPRGISFESMGSQVDVWKPDVPRPQNPMPPGLQAQPPLPLSSMWEPVCQPEVPSTMPPPAVLGIPIDSPENLADFDVQDEFEESPPDDQQLLASLGLSTASPLREVGSQPTTPPS